MSTICLAPLGMQPGAVVAPLLSLGLTAGDEIVLLTTEPIEKAGVAARAEAALLKKVSGIGVRKQRVAGVPADVKRFERAILLINGGESATVHRLSDELQGIAGSKRVQYAESRGVRGCIFDPHGTELQEFEVADVGLPSLLELINVVHHERKGVLANREDESKTVSVEELIERAGALYAVVLVDARTGNNLPREVNPARLAAYRSLLRWQTLQQDLGLEPRRLLLSSYDTPAYPQDDWPARLANRAARDGFLAVGQNLQNGRLDRNAWRDLVRAGEAASLPEQISLPREPHVGDPKPFMGSGHWSGVPLYVIAGTQPGTALRTIWAHQPSRVTWVYDPQSTAVRRVSARTARIGDGFGATAIDFRTLPETLSGPPIDGAHVSLTAGDKSSKFRLKLWADRANTPAHPEQRGGFMQRLFGGSQSISSARPRVTECYLDGCRTSCGQVGSHVPVCAWIAAHTDLYLTHAEHVACPPPERESEAAVQAATNVFRALASGMKLAERGAIPNELKSDVLAACGQVREEGFWMEDLAAVLLARACDEVVKGVSLGLTQSSRDRFEDEIDVVTARNGFYSLWSCKTTSQALGIARAARDARAQATRFLGRMELAVVVVPRLHWAPREMRNGKGWWQYDELTWVVDLAFLSDAHRTATLAGTRPSGPRGPGRWNPFTP